MHELIGLAAVAVAGAALAAPPAKGGVDEGRPSSSLICNGKSGTVNLALKS